MNKEADITIILNNYDADYITIDNKDSLTKIHNLFMHNVSYCATTSTEYLYLGWYYCNVTKNYPMMEVCYQTAISNGCAIAMNNFAFYHRYNTKDYISMEKYYEMAISNGCAIAMNNFANYHQHTKDYISMEKYYEMAISNGCVMAMHNFAFYHQYTTKDYISMEKYYEMAISAGYVTSMMNFAYYHRDVTKDYILMEKYYFMALSNGSKEALPALILHYESNNLYIKLLDLHILYTNDREEIIKAFNLASYAVLNESDGSIFFDLVSKFEFKPDDKLCISLKLFLNSRKDQLDIMDLHFTYTIHGIGYDVAKEDFRKKCIY